MRSTDNFSQEAKEAKLVHDKAHEERLAAEAKWLKELHEYEEIDEQYLEAVSNADRMAHEALEALEEMKQHEKELRAEAEKEKEEEVTGM